MVYDYPSIHVLQIQSSINLFIQYVYLNVTDLKYYTILYYKEKNSEQSLHNDPVQHYPLFIMFAGVHRRGLRRTCGRIIRYVV